MFWWQKNKSSEHEHAADTGGGHEEGGGGQGGSFSEGPPKKFQKDRWSWGVGVRASRNEANAADEILVTLTAPLIAPL
jgi:hypothetical protein